MNKYDLNEKVAIVTGARRGIGKGIALKLAENGAKVVVTDISKEDCEKVVDEIKEKNGEALALKLDVTNEDEIKEVVDKTVEKYGKIDILVNNAGIYIAKELDNMETSEIDKELNINLKGPILCTKNVLPKMKEKNYGKIITIASIAGFVGFAQSSIYCATKGALVNMTRELALDLGKNKINVNGIAPGVIDTPMTKDMLEDENIKNNLMANIPYGRIGKPEDIANAVAFLASDEAEYITGQILAVDGGWLTH
ncbi:SDR family oxidoreductase [Candidatus Woesearchaeota archaeon]|nr:SDR family oxidoreductase [Candidatus Woesearchaeota archaeon]